MFIKSSISKTQNSKIKNSKPRLKFEEDKGIEREVITKINCNKTLWLKYYFSREFNHQIGFCKCHQKTHKNTKYKLQRSCDLIRI